MKNSFLTLVLLFILIIPTSGQIMGPAILFDYDNVGNRIKRYYNPSTPLNVYRTTKDSTSQYPVDTAVVLTKDMQIYAYPNPVLTTLTIENRSWVQGQRAEIKVHDMNGKLIASKAARNAKENIPFGDVSSGIYSVQYFFNGEMIANWKVFKTNDN